MNIPHPRISLYVLALALALSLALAVALVQTTTNDNESQSHSDSDSDYIQGGQTPGSDSSESTLDETGGEASLSFSVPRRNLESSEFQSKMTKTPSSFVSSLTSEMTSGSGTDDEDLPSTVKQDRRVRFESIGIGTSHVMPGQATEFAKSLVEMVASLERENLALKCQLNSQKSDILKQG